MRLALEFENGNVDYDLIGQLKGWAGQVYWKVGIETAKADMAAGM